MSKVGIDLTVDGNRAAGALEEVFGVEMTTALTICGHCGATGELGTLRCYERAPGIVLRCVHCDGVLIRLVASEGRTWLDLRGMASLELRATHT
jgi:Family of unknown function (DUF6510)